jgi:hypothetical protein
MMAATILALVIATSLTVLQSGVRAVDTARCMSVAGQIGQSELEVLRLRNWAQISALPVLATISISDTINSGTGTSLDAGLKQITDRFSCTRAVTDVKVDMRMITVVVSWQGNDGRPHTVVSQARYARNGLNDYMYVSH